MQGRACLCLLVDLNPGLEQLPGRMEGEASTRGQGHQGRVISCFVMGRGKPPCTTEALGTRDPSLQQGGRFGRKQD